MVGITPSRGGVGGVLGGGSPDVAGLGEWGDSTRNQLPFKDSRTLQLELKSPKYEREAIGNM